MNLNIRRPFDPALHGLDASFRLTRYADLKGLGCKINSDVQSKLLEPLQDLERNKLTIDEIYTTYSTPNPILGIGLDGCIMPIRHGGLTIVNTTCNLYPIIDDPYMMGKVACSAILANMYAMGVTECDNIQLSLVLSLKMNDKERDTVVPIIIEGFKDLAEEVRVCVNGGQTIVGPHMMLGGTTTSVCQPNEHVMPDNAMVGDVLVLTKPLGTMVAATAYQWLEITDKWNRIKLVVSEDDVKKGYQRAMFSMARLNRTAAYLMHKYNAHGATDIGGYGLLGHANKLAGVQKNEVGFVIHNLPIISKMASISKACGNLFGLIQGHSAETSGGLLISFPREQAAAFCKEIEKYEGYQAWIIGIVEKGGRTARIIDKPRVIEVPAKDKEGELW